MTVQGSKIHVIVISTIIANVAAALIIFYITQLIKKDKELTVKYNDRSVSLENLNQLSFHNEATRQLFNNLHITELKVENTGELSIKANDMEDDLAILFPSEISIITQSVQSNSCPFTLVKNGNKILIKRKMINPGEYIDITIHSSGPNGISDLNLIFDFRISDCPINFLKQSLPEKNQVDSDLVIMLSVACIIFFGITNIACFKYIHLKRNLINEE